MSSDYRSANHNKPRQTRTRAKKRGFFYKIKTGFLSMSVAKRAVIISLIAVILALITALTVSAVSASAIVLSGIV